MAFVNMFNNNEHQTTHFVDPRISFSNDFADTKHNSTLLQDQIKYKEAPVSSDFEFSVDKYAMIPADKIFSDGVMLPFKEDFHKRKVTLREELTADHDYDVSKGFFGWKDRLGFKNKRNERKKNGIFAYDHPGFITNKAQNCLLAKIYERDE